MVDSESSPGTRLTHVVEPLPATDPEIGRWLWALDDARRQTLALLAGQRPTVLDWYDLEVANSVGTLLTHLAAIEADWLYVEVLERDPAPDLLALLPPRERDRDG